MALTTRRGLLAACLALALLPTVSLAAEAPQSAARSGDCDLAKELPADADARSRRIACEIPVKYQSDVLIAENVGSL
ncbi:MAG: hypothetical protein JF591_22770, partial [Lysobacter sp.]|nr:hypothetical protein [Lysobacter sp.]